jgi:hypothetical protein
MQSYFRAHGNDEYAGVGKLISTGYRHQTSVLRVGGLFLEEAIQPGGSIFLKI